MTKTLISKYSQGYTTSQISKEYGVSNRTIERRVKSYIINKGFKTKSQAVAELIKKKLIKEVTEISTYSPNELIAFRKGLKENKNPYKKGNDLWKAWNKGWSLKQD